jgi:hypothetical protein
MTNIAQKARRITTRTIIIAVLLLIGPLAISSAQAAGTFCPCFSATTIDASFEELGGNGVEGLENGTAGSFFCSDNGSDVFFSFRSEDNTVSTTVFSEPFPSGILGCGWSGRPLDVTAQEARECSDQIRKSWAWKVLDCPNQ